MNNKIKKSPVFKRSRLYECIGKLTVAEDSKSIIVGVLMDLDACPHILITTKSKKENKK